MAEVKLPLGNATSTSSQQGPDSPRNDEPNANANNTNTNTNTNSVSKSSVALMSKRLSSVKLASVGRVAARGRTATMNALNLGRSPNTTAQSSPSRGVPTDTAWGGTNSGSGTKHQSSGYSVGNLLGVAAISSPAATIRGWTTATAVSDSGSKDLSAGGKGGDGMGFGEVEVGSGATGAGFGYEHQSIRKGYLLMLRSTSREGGIPSGGAGAAGGGAGGAGPVSGGEWSERFFYLSGHFLRYKKHSLNLTSVNLKQTDHVEFNLQSAVVEPLDNTNLAGGATGHSGEASGGSAAGAASWDPAFRPRGRPNAFRIVSNAVVNNVGDHDGTPVSTTTVTRASMAPSPKRTSSYSSASSSTSSIAAGEGDAAAIAAAGAIAEDGRMPRMSSTPASTGGGGEGGGGGADSFCSVGSRSNHVRASSGPIQVQQKQPQQTSTQQQQRCRARQQVWVLAANSEKERAMWMQAIKNAIHFGQGLLSGGQGCGEAGSLCALAARMSLELEVRDRHHRLRIFRSCFLGEDAVSWLQSECGSSSCSVEEALSTGNKMIAAGLIYHCTYGHALENSRLFYKFADSVISRARALSSSGVRAGRAGSGSGVGGRRGSGTVARRIGRYGRSNSGGGGSGGIDEETGTEVNETELTADMDDGVGTEDPEDDFDGDQDFDDDIDDVDDDIYDGADSVSELGDGERASGGVGEGSSRGATGGRLGGDVARSNVDGRGGSGGGGSGGVDDGSRIAAKNGVVERLSGGVDKPQKQANKRGSGRGASSGGGGNIVSLKRVARELEGLKLSCAELERSQLSTERQALSYASRVLACVETSMDILVLSTLATVALAVMSMSLQAEIISAFWLGGSAVARRFSDSNGLGRWESMDDNQSADAGCADRPYERCYSSDDGGAGCDLQQDAVGQGWIWSSCSRVWGGRWCSPEEAFLGLSGKGRDGQDWESMLASFWWRQRFIQVLITCLMLVMVYMYRHRKSVVGAARVAAEAASNRDGAGFFGEEALLGRGGLRSDVPASTRAVPLLHPGQIRLLAAVVSETAAGNGSGGGRGGGVDSEPGSMRQALAKMASNRPLMSASLALEHDDGVINAGSVGEDGEMSAVAAGGGGGMGVGPGAGVSGGSPEILGGGGGGGGGDKEEGEEVAGGGVPEWMQRPELKSLPPEKEWAHHPIFVRLSPSVPGQVRLDGHDPHSSIPVNSDDVAVPFETPLFKGRLMVRVAGLPSRVPGQGDAAQEYFRGKKRLMQCAVQGSFKRELAFDRAYTGQSYRRPFTMLPAKWLIRSAFSVIRRLSPALREDITGDNPYMVSPLAATAQSLRAEEPGDEVAIVSDISEETALLGDSFMDRRVPASARKKFFSNPRNLKAYSFKPGVVYTFDFYQHLYNAVTFELDLGFRRVKLADYLNHQPAQIMAMDLETREMIWNVEIWNSALLQLNGSS